MTVRPPLLSISLLLAASAVLAAPAFAQTAAPRLVPFQGRLTDAQSQPLNGVYRLTFRIYDQPAGGTPLWEETHSTASVIAGQLNVLLGSLVLLDDRNGDGNAADAVRFDAGLAPRYLGITVDPAGPAPSTAQEMFPRHQLVPSFHARTADVASAVTDSAIKTNMIADQAVTGGKIADGTIGPDDLQKTPFLTGSNIQPSSITGQQLAPGAVASSTIADGAISLRDLDPAASSWLAPTGSVLAFAGPSVPLGFLVCDGRALPRAQFPDLFAAVGTVHGDGSRVDGTPTGFVATHFNLPDYRGRFLRGRDSGRGRDPDSADRTPQQAGGASGDEVGSVQGDDIESHTHGVRVVNSDPSGPPAAIDSTPVSAGYVVLQNQIERSGGSETRPVNAYVQYLIKCGRSDSC